MKLAESIKYKINVNIWESIESIITSKVYESIGPHVFLVIEKDIWDVVEIKTISINETRSIKK